MCKKKGAVLVEELYHCDVGHWRSVLFAVDWVEIEGGRDGWVVWKLSFVYEGKETLI